MNLSHIKGFIEFLSNFFLFFLRTLSRRQGLEKKRKKVPKRLKEKRP